MKMYIRLKDHDYEGQEILFPTTDRVRAFTMTDEDKNDEYFFRGDNQFLFEFEDETKVMTYRWQGDVAGFQPCPDWY